MNRLFKIRILVALVTMVAWVIPARAARTAPDTLPLLPTPSTEGNDVPFSFAVAADTRGFTGPGSWDTPAYFRGIVEAIAALGNTAFMVMPGDIDPPEQVDWTIRTYLGASYPWYPVVGNHDTEEDSYMDWHRAYNYDANGELLPHIMRSGPPGSEETTYAFDYGNAHFVILNEYYDGSSDTGSDGDVVDALYQWLVEDLNATDKEHIFVFGHEPGYPQPDAETGRERHMTDSLNRHPATRDRFWALLREKGVTAYLCGHTHNYSAVMVEGVWQLDAGHAQGMGDTEVRSTFIVVHVDGPSVTFETYRDDKQGGPYSPVERGILAAPSLTLGFAVDPDVGAEATATLAEQAAAAFAAESGYDIYAYVLPCEAAVADALVSREVDLAWLSPTAYALAREQRPIKAALSAAPAGDDPYRGAFLTRSDQGIHALADLAEKNIAFVTSTAEAGYLYPALQISTTQGLTPSAFFSQTLFLGSPEAVVEAVYLGKHEGRPIHGGAVYDDARVLLQAQYPDIFTETQVLTYTPAIPGTAIALSLDAEAIVASQVTDTLRSFASTAIGQGALSPLQNQPSLAQTVEEEYEEAQEVATLLTLQLDPCSILTPISGEKVSGITYTTGGFTTTVHLPQVPLSDALQLSYTPIPALTHRPGGFDTGHAFALGTVTSTTLQMGVPAIPYTLTVSYPETAVPPALEGFLALTYWDGSRWREEGSSQIDTVRNVVAVTPAHRASRWALVAARRLYLPAILRDF